MSHEDEQHPLICIEIFIRCAGGLRARRLTRKVDDLVKALGVDGISKSEVSASAPSWTRPWPRFARAPLTASIATCGSMRRTTRCASTAASISQATVVAVGVTSDGERQVLGVDVGPSRTGVLDRVSAQSRQARPEGRAPGDLGCARGADAAISTVLTRHHLAALSRALHAQRAGDRAVRRREAMRDRAHHHRSRWCRLSSRLREDRVVVDPAPIRQPRDPAGAPAGTSHRQSISTIFLFYFFFSIRPTPGRRSMRPPMWRR